ncbi:uncharacterized protein B0J16DRAFT_381774 [Fusarium flagelliforme]|uniref:uncharacterized protein n=1 Tax=Fusarium flagelliforme TaxID=2675880 RepID=UPI001E8D004D|nr:uncharacterized protein B0J16DRAFT_381774 [Fusarium flagelliforme]KAH7193895.1 hypothetical protein B0J16DRAFT_381774 [Fusarium flagelliforme]
MRVTATFGSLIMGASLCAARACAPHPRPTTTSSLSSEIGTSKAGGAATTTTSQETVSTTESIESSVTIETSTADSATTELETTTSGSTSQETFSVTGSETSAESSATTTDDISSFTTIVASTTAVTSEETETSTTVDEATTTTAEATTTTAGPPVITNLVENGGFEDETNDPWVVEGATPAVFRSFFCGEGNKCMQLAGNFNNFAKVCQRVEVEAGFEYTFKAKVLQNCIKSYGSNIEVCEDNVNTAELSIDGVYDSGEHGIVGYNSYNDYTYTFAYTGPSIDSTDLCITITQNQGLSPSFYLDGVSFTRGQAVPIPDPTE